MARSRRQFRCSECGATAPAWTGCCTRCRAWDTMEEDHPDAERVPVRTVVESLASYGGVDVVPVPTGIDEVDQVLGGGLVPGSVTLLSGEPGIGKSTLTLQIAASVASTGAGVVLVTGEESPAQVSSRARRLCAVPESLDVLDSTRCETVEDVMADALPQLVVVDSVQTLRTEASDAAAGSATQVRGCAARLVDQAKRQGVSVLMIGHVTKDGSLAGPRLLEHVVDTVLSFSGDRSGDLRFLRADKHRFGATNSVGVFEMAAEGLRAVADPSERFLQDRASTSGSVVVPMIDGQRPVLVEVQALAAEKGESGPFLTTQGVPASRCRLVAAVLEQRAGLRCTGRELFVSLVGGLHSDDPGLDLAVAVALWSAIESVAVAPDVVVWGELGLGGELRTASRSVSRLQEAHRSGFRRAVVPASVDDPPAGLGLLRCSSLTETLQAVASCGAPVHEWAPMTVQ